MIGKSEPVATMHIAKLTTMVAWRKGDLLILLNSKWL